MYVCMAMLCALSNWQVLENDHHTRVGMDIPLWVHTQLPKDPTPARHASKLSERPMHVQCMLASGKPKGNRKPQQHTACITTHIVGQTPLTVGIQNGIPPQAKTLQTTPMPLAQVPKESYNQFWDWARMIDKAQGDYYKQNAPNCPASLHGRLPHKVPSWYA